MTVMISTPGGGRVKFRVRRGIVVGPKPEFAVVIHVDDDRSDDSIAFFVAECCSQLADKEQRRIDMPTEVQLLRDNRCLKGHWFFGPQAKLKALMKDFAAGKFTADAPPRNTLLHS